MQFRLITKSQRKRFKKQLWIKVAEGSINIKTVRRVYTRKPFLPYALRSFRKTVLPVTSVPYILVGFVAVLIVMFFCIFDLQGNIDDMTKQNEALAKNNYQINHNMDSLNNILTQSKTASRVQLETIYNQAQLIADIESLASRSEDSYKQSITDLEQEHKENVDNLTQEKDQLIQNLIDYINSYDIFGHPVFNSSDLS